MSIKMSVVVNKLNGIAVIMPEIFKDIKANFGDYEISFEYNNMNFIVNLKSDKLTNEELEKIFWEFYSYLGFVLGYFPNIIEATFMDEVYLANIVEQYKTKECFIRVSEQYIHSMKEDFFRDSFIKFRKLYKKSDFQFAMFNVAMMKSNHYPEITVLNILQSLDGLYEVIYSNKSTSKKILRSKIKRFVDNVNTIDIENISIDEIEKIKDYMQKIGDITFYDKLIYMCNICKYDIFKNEKEFDKENRYYFYNLIDMFVNTRNKFSHSIHKKNTLTGTEATTYIFKIIMLYRILILEEIDLVKLIDEDVFLKNLKEWDDYIIPTIEKDRRIENV